MKPLIIDIDFFSSPDELGLARKNGFEVIQTSLDEVHDWPMPDRVTSAMLRCERIEKERYSTIYHHLLERGVKLINDPDMCERASEFSLQYPLIRPASPRSVISHSSAVTDDVLSAISDAGLEFPVFIKTERKSLKDKSLVATEAELGTTLNALRAAFAPFKTFVTKEVVPLEKDDSRGFVFRNSLISFDTGPLVGKLDFPQDPIYHFFYKWMADLGSKSFCDFYIMDVTRRTDSEAFVIVEIKDAQFTKVKRPEFFWRSFAQKFE